MAFIPDDKVEEVRTSTDIVDVVDSYVKLKKRGRNYLGLCPFHSEKTPSFNVNPEMQIFKCFGCGVGGDVYQFLMRVENLSFPEAVRTLAEASGVELPTGRSDQEPRGKSESIFAALSFAGRYYHANLRSERGKRVLDYLVAHRGLKESTLVQFGVGYALPDWEALVGEAETAKLDSASLVDAGLCVKGRDGRILDRYRNRIMIPILSPVGKVLGFGGRIFGEAEGEPKYINSPETAVYHKSKTLYGLYWTKGAIRRTEEALLVEGYTDVMGLFQAGVENVVATCGTSLTREQAGVLKRYCKVVTLLYDGDVAGVRAASRAVQVLLPEGLIPHVVALPAGHDPDSFALEYGGEGLTDYVQKHKQDFVEFYFKSLVTEDQSPEAKADAQRKTIQLLHLVADELVRESYLKRTARVLGLTEVQIRRVLKASRPRAPRPRKQEEIAIDATASRVSDVQDPTERPLLPEEKTLLRLMLEHGEPVVEQVLGNMALTEFTAGPARETATQILTMYEAGDVDPTGLLSGDAGEAVKNLVAGIFTREVEPSRKNWEKRKIQVPDLDEDAHRVASDAMRLLKLDRLKERIDHQQEKILLFSNDPGRVARLQEEMVALQRARKDIVQSRYSDWNDV